MLRYEAAALICLSLFACKKSTISAAEHEENEKKRLEAAKFQKDPIPAPTPEERLMSMATVTEALAELRPSFRDTINKPDTAALTFAAWAANHLTWQQIQGLPETKHALVLKDPEVERGKRNCYAGKIAEIQVDRSLGTPVYLGGLVTGSQQVARFAAVGSTGELVQDSSARFCGIVTGKYSYDNALGGTTHAVYVVGMFDLPENKKPPAAPSAEPAAAPPG